MSDLLVLLMAIALLWLLLIGGLLDGIGLATGWIRSALGKLDE